MEQKKKPFNKGGRKPKLDPRTHRYSLNLDDVENAKFLAFYDQSGYKVKAHFIKNCRLLHPTLPTVFTIQEHRYTV